VGKDLQGVISKGFGSVDCAGEPFGD